MSYIVVQVLAAQIASHSIGGDEDKQWNIVVDERDAGGVACAGRVIVDHGEGHRGTVAKWIHPVAASGATVAAAGAGASDLRCCVGIIALDPNGLEVVERVELLKQTRTVELPAGVGPSDGVVNHDELAGVEIGLQADLCAVAQVVGHERSRDGMPADHLRVEGRDRKS